MTPEGVDALLQSHSEFKVIGQGPWDGLDVCDVLRALKEAWAAEPFDPDYKLRRCGKDGCTFSASVFCPTHTLNREGEK